MEFARANLEAEAWGAVFLAGEGRICVAWLLRLAGALPLSPTL